MGSQRKYRGVMMMRRAATRFYGTALPTRPIGFELSDEQTALQDLARKATAEHVIPVAAHHDETGEFPWEPLKKLHELGLMNWPMAAPGSRRRPRPTDWRRRRWCSLHRRS